MRRTRRAGLSMPAAGLRLARRVNRATLGLWLGLARPASAKRGKRVPPAQGMTGFGSNPGQLRMCVHLPRGCMPERGAPLIVVLHGCRQDAQAFGRDSGWCALADRLGVPLLLPEQQAVNNPHLCFNWFRPGDVARGQGEAMSIRQMVRAATLRFGSDRLRVFVVGLSAGGAMTAALLAAYPAVFAAGAVVAGMPVGIARDGTAALLRMRRSSSLLGQAALVAAARGGATRPAGARWPRLSVWKGHLDRTVAPGNAELLVSQWLGLHGLGAAPSREEEPMPGVRRQLWGDAAVELWALEGVGHGFPIAAAEPGGGSPAAWVVEAGIPAVRHIARFWGLIPVLPPPEA